MAPSAVADLSLGQPLEAPESVRQAFQQATAMVRPRRFGYMPNLGYPELRERIAEDVDVAGVTAQSVAVTVGAAGAISMALRTFVEAGQRGGGDRPLLLGVPALQRGLRAPAAGGASRGGRLSSTWRLSRRR